jgi:hypothetical protein
MRTTTQGGGGEGVFVLFCFVVFWFWFLVFVCDACFFSFIVQVGLVDGVSLSLSLSLSLSGFFVGVVWGVGD